MKIEHEKLELFIQKLLEWNRIHNLTGAKTPQEVQANIDDSLYPLTFLPEHIERAMDVGTGAGFPGLILAMAMPKTSWILVEPRKKRAAFLHYMKNLLHLENVEIAMRRVQDLPSQTFDLITSRAVAKTEELLGMLRPFIAPHTLLLFYKGEEVEKEIDGLKHFCIIEHDKRKYLLLKGEDVV